ncbi:MAG: lytic transglycosylase domain-containing protein [Salinivirgaceae bacterium]|jgi:membrane-bound lytic murein transglycosylase D|nr:lytic transglycosylase domain-containing protein [Salinivirgaceae bacterium]
MNKVKAVLVAVVLISVVGLFFHGFSSVDDVKESIPDSEPFNKFYSIVPVKLPDNVEFAGEIVPIYNFDTYESLDREVLVNTYWQSQTLIFIKRANRYFPLIDSILKIHNVPSDFKYLALAESGLSNAVSPANAVGFWQFLKGTALDHKLEVNNEVDERYNLEKATHAAAIYLNYLYDKFQSWSMTAAAYNMGRRNTINQIDRQKTNSYYDLVLGEETGRYVFRLIALKLILETPEKFGFKVSNEDKYQPIPYTEIVVDSAIHSLPNFANEMGVNYKVLKELNPWLREDRLTNKSKKSYTIKIAAAGVRTIEANQTFFPENKND